MADLAAELAFRERAKSSVLAGRKEKLSALKKHKKLRDPAGETRLFLAQSEAPAGATAQTAHVWRNEKENVASRDASGADWLVTVESGVEDP